MKRRSFTCLNTRTGSVILNADFQPWRRNEVYHRDHSLTDAGWGFPDRRRSRSSPTAIKTPDVRRNHGRALYRQRADVGAAPGSDRATGGSSGGTRQTANAARGVRATRDEVVIS